MCVGPIKALPLETPAVNSSNVQVLNIGANNWMTRGLVVMIFSTGCFARTSGLSQTYYQFKSI